MNAKTMAMIALPIAMLAMPTYAKNAPLPAATYDSVAYGTHKMQCMDVWLPKDAKKPTPVVIFIHGGGFRNGNRKSSGTGKYLPACRKAGGGSAGAHSSLCVALTDDNALGVRAIFPIHPQTSMDPKEMREWIPNSRYGGALFGYKSFQEWLDHRDDCAKWIERYSPMALLAKCDPKKAPVIIFEGHAAPKPGVVEKDPTHSGTFIEKFKDAAEKRGVPCRRGKMDDFIKELTK